MQAPALAAYQAQLYWTPSESADSARRGERVRTQGTKRKERSLTVPGGAISESCVGALGGGVGGRGGNSKDDLLDRHSDSTGLLRGGEEQFKSPSGAMGKVSHGEKNVVLTRMCGAPPVPESVPIPSENQVNVHACVVSFLGARRGRQHGALCATGLCACWLAALYSLEF